MHPMRLCLWYYEATVYLVEMFHLWKSGTKKELPLKMFFAGKHNATRFCKRTIWEQHGYGL